MYNKPHKIVISKPCAQDWDTMHSTASGKFCTSCNKNVIDFTSFRDDEIIDYLIANKGRETCGRFYKKQIETIRIEFPDDILLTQISGWKQFLVLFLVCFGYHLFNVEFAIAQSNVSDSLETIIVNDTLGKADYVPDDSSLNFVEKKDSAKVNKGVRIKKIRISSEFTMMAGNVCLSPVEIEKSKSFWERPLPVPVKLKKEPREKNPVKKEAENKSEMMLVSNTLINRKRRKALTIG